MGKTVAELRDIITRLEALQQLTKTPQWPELVRHLELKAEGFRKRILSSTTAWSPLRLGQDQGHLGELESLMHLEDVAKKDMARAQEELTKASEPPPVRRDVLKSRTMPSLTAHNARKDP